VLFYRKIMLFSFKKIVKKHLRLLGKLIPDSYPASTFFLLQPEKHVFFGYYDVSPFHSDQDIALAMMADIANESPHIHHPEIKIGFFNLKDKDLKFQPLTQSMSWNWQQGCRLQWMPGEGANFLFNDYESGRYISKVFSLSERTVRKKYDMPVYAVSCNGETALTLDFERLHRYRPGYGYNNGSKNQFNDNVAVYLMDLRNSEQTSFILYSQLHDIMGKPYENKEYINHLSFSPDGKTFLFFYVKIEKGKRKTSLFLSHTEKKELKYILGGYSPSHYCWKNEKTILITAFKNDGRKRLHYLLVDSDSGKFKIVNEQHLKKDGHPSFINDDHFISDTYPSLLGHQQLFAANGKATYRQNIASFYLPQEFAGETRCDLHPRLSQQKDKICTDIVKNGKRAMAVIPMDIKS
jgi:hypothetical protein